MSHSTQNPTPNRLLAALPPQVGAHLASFIRVEHPPQGRILNSASLPATDVWFPHTGTVALITTDASGRSIQTGLVGRTGCVGLDPLFGDTRGFANAMAPAAMIQIAGAMSAIPLADLRTEMHAGPHLQIALSRFLYRLSAQSLQTIACNRLHDLRARCCRWLLTMYDMTDSDDLPVTQDNLATLLGGGRPRINGLLASMEQDGLVRRHRAGSACGRAPGSRMQAANAIANCPIGNRQKRRNRLGTFKRFGFVCHCHHFPAGIFCSSRTIGWSRR